MNATRAYLRSLDPHLPRSVWLVQIGGAVNAFGTGMVIPFTLIYLHNVRGISLAAAGAAVGIGAVAALATGVLAGSIVDRVGGRNTLVFGLLLQAGSIALFPQVRTAWDAAVLLALQGAGTACFWPGQSTLLARLADPETRHHAYALQRISMNLGIGLGGVVGGLIATTADPQSFTTLYLFDAATFLAFVVVLAFVREPRPAAMPLGEARPGYREVVRDRPFLALLGLNVVFVAAGYETLLLAPVYAKNQAGVSERWIGMIWFANTLFIVLAQMPISKWLEGRRRMVALAAMNVCFAAAALVILVGGTLFEGDRGGARDDRRDADLRRRASACRGRRRVRSSPTWRRPASAGATSRSRACRGAPARSSGPRSAGRCSAGSRTPSGRSRPARACSPERAASRWSGACRPPFAARRVSQRASCQPRQRVFRPARAGRMRRMSTPILDDPLSTDAQPASHQASAAAAACRERRSGSAPAR